MSSLSDFNYDFDVNLMYELDAEYQETGIVSLEMRRRMREFLENDYSFLSLSKLGKNGIYFNHQELFSRFMKVFALKRTCIMDEAGSGKTRKAINYVIDTLRSNVTGSIDVSNYFNMGQSVINKVYYVANNNSLIEKFKSELTRSVSSAKYDSSKSIETSILGSISMKTYNSFVKEVSEYATREDLADSGAFDNTLVIVDEVHNVLIDRGYNTDSYVQALINEVDNNDFGSDKTKSAAYKALYRLKDTNATVIYMSASVLVNTENQLSALLTLMHGQYITTDVRTVEVNGKSVRTLNLRDDYEYLTLLYFGFIRASREDMHVSYASNTKIGYSGTTVKVLSHTNDQGETEGVANEDDVRLEILAYKMSIYQSYYTEMFNIKFGEPDNEIRDDEDTVVVDSSNSFYTMSEKIYVALPIREAILKKYKTPEELHENIGDVDSEYFQQLYPPGDQGAIPFEVKVIHKMENLAKVSTVYYNFILNLTRSLNESSKYADSMPSSDIAFSEIYGIGAYAVYLRDIKNYAINLLVDILENNDHQIVDAKGKEHPFKFARHTSRTKSTGPRYAVITSKTSDVERRNILRKLKSSSNFSGKLIKLVIFSNSVQGLDVISNEIHSLSFPWNMSNAYQSLYRVVRTDVLKPLEEQVRTRYLDYSVNIKMYIYAAYPSYHIGLRDRGEYSETTIRYYNSDIRLMRYSYNISKFKSVIRKDDKLTPHYTRLRENSYDFNLNNYMDIEKGDFCLINCAILPQDDSFNDRVRAIREGRSSLDVDAEDLSLYLAVFMRSDIYRNVRVPKLASRNTPIADVRSYYVLKHSEGLFISREESVTISVPNQLKGEKQNTLDDRIEYLERVLEMRYEYIADMYNEQIDDIEYAADMVESEINSFSLKLDIIKGLSDVDEQRILYEYINFWFVIRAPSSKAQQYNIIDYQRIYLIDELSTNLLERESNKLIVFHSLNNQTNIGNNFNIGRTFIGAYSLLNFRYLKAEDSWNVDKDVNLTNYIKNMFTLKRYAYLGLIYRFGNIAAVVNYDSRDESNQSYRFYYYPNISRSDKYKFRGNSYKYPSTIAMNMTLLRMRPSNYGNMYKITVTHTATREKLGIYNEKKYVDALYATLRDNDPKLAKIINTISENLVDMDYNVFVKRLYKFYKLSSSDKLTSINLMIKYVDEYRYRATEIPILIREKLNFDYYLRSENKRRR